MGNLAALLILVACPASGGECLSDPVRVVSFDRPALCERRLPEEIKKAARAGVEIYGNCHPVGANLLSGRTPIDVTVASYSFKSDRVAGASTGWSRGLSFGSSFLSP